MAGGISTEEKCPICAWTGTKAKKEDTGKHITCELHPEWEYTGHCRVKLGFKGDSNSTQKRFETYGEARRFLNALQVQVDEGKYDKRDYKKDNPLGFQNLAEQWLKVKKRQIKLRSWNNLNNYLSKAGDVWGNRNVKEIGYAEIEDFLFITLGLSDKSRSNARSALHDFWEWMRKRKTLMVYQIPEFPEVSFELGWRTTISKATQETILGEIKRISWDINPRIWIAAKWLATYFSIRPAEMFRIREGEINRDKGYLIIAKTSDKPGPKEKKPKVIPMIEEDVTLVSTLPVAFPNMPFFRHINPRKGVKVGTQFAPDYVREWWVRACTNLKIQNVDLYGGTRHSTVVELGEFFTPEQLKHASFHSTNKAFERYYRMKPDQAREIYETGRNMENSVERKRNAKSTTSRTNSPRNH